jgi:hypothetical protein
MAATSYIYGGGGWKKAKTIYVHDGSTWRKLKKAYCHDGSAWRLVFQESAGLWTQLGGLVPRADFRAVCVHLGELYCVDSGGKTVHRWDGSAWVNIGTPGSPASSSALRLASDGTDVFAVSSNGILSGLYRWNGGTSWIRVLSGFSPRDLTSVGGNIYVTAGTPSVADQIWRYDSLNVKTSLGLVSAGLVHQVNGSYLLALNTTGSTVKQWDTAVWSDYTTAIPYGNLYNIVTVGGVDYWASDYGMHKRVGTSWVLMPFPYPSARFVSDNAEGRIAICKYSSPQVIQNLNSDMSTWTDFGTPSSFVNPFRYVYGAGGVYVFDTAGVWKYTP